MNVIFNLLARLLPTKSVDQIVAVLTTVAGQLAAAEAAQLARINEIDAQMQTLRGERAIARNEAERAGRVAANLSNLTA